MKDYHLPEKTLKELREAHKYFKQLNRARQADKIKSVYLLGLGWSIGSICEALLLDDNTIYRYYDTFVSEGISGLVKTHYKGSETKLTATELSDLKLFLTEHPCRATKQVVAYLLKEFDVEYSISGANALLKRLGYTYKKPRVVPGKADINGQQKFIKKYRRLRNSMKAKDSLFFMDGVHPQHNPLVQYGWFKKGVRYPLKTNTQYHRLHINGAIDIDNFDVVIESDLSINAETTLNLFEKLRKRRPEGKLYLVLDNAGYYKSKRVQKYAKALGITLLYLPPYSPNLNLIERLWGFMQRDILYNRYYPTFEHMKQACFNFFKGLAQRKSELTSLLTEKFEILPG